MNEIPLAKEVYKEAKIRADILNKEAIEEVTNELIENILKMKENGFFGASYTTKNPFIDTNSICETICEKFTDAGYKTGYYSTIAGSVHFWVKWEDIEDED